MSPYRNRGQLELHVSLVGSASDHEADSIAVSYKDKWVDVKVACFHGLYHDLVQRGTCSIWAQRDYYWIRSGNFVLEYDYIKTSLCEKS